MFEKIINILQNFIKKSSNTLNKPNDTSTTSSISTYREQTGNGLLSTFFNKGNYGEFSSYGKISKLPGHHKVLFNIYLPNGKEKTTEIDLVYLHETGIYVIESKNYSGWIFGDEKSHKWMQTMPNGQKYPFYNPIKQNKGHIKALQNLLPAIQKEIYTSIIVFSERCTLKKIQYDAKNTFVINRYDLGKLMLKQIESSNKILEKEYIDKIYNFLSQYSKADNTTKMEHIQNINK